MTMVRVTRRSPSRIAALALGGAVLAGALGCSVATGASGGDGAEATDQALTQKQIDALGFKWMTFDGSDTMVAGLSSPEVPAYLDVVAVTPNGQSKLSVTLALATIDEKKAVAYYEPVKGSPRLSGICDDGTFRFSPAVCAALAKLVIPCVYHSTVQPSTIYREKEGGQHCKTIETVAQ